MTCSNSLADAILSPVIRIVRATPVASFIILALLWMNRTAVPVLMSMLMVVPVVWENIVAQYQAEVLSQPTSAIGTDLYYAKIYLETPDLFAWTSVVIILSMYIEKIIRNLLFRGKTNEGK